jgi:plasmid maintenance system killer protein
MIPYHPVVEVSFETERLAKICNSEKALVRSYGPEGAKRIARRLTQLAAAASLEDLRNGPGRCHELVGDRDGCLSLDLNGPIRLIFRPGDVEPGRRKDRGLVWEAVIEVVVIEIVDTHE